ncbi:uncharacterized protein LOC128240593 [Mya arenaria]|uniref:uncharacterized protein LOC128240593 n=1 Tax=Mya arenaria TaxID=6604 RepID=UPI0022E98584|nr:uncharacterized protein LOC128240593 [Mya arenaria]
MAAPMSSSSVLGLKLKRCSHNKTDKNILVSLPNNKNIEDVWHIYHDTNVGKSSVTIKCSTEMSGATNFDVEGSMTVGTLVQNFGIKVVEFTCIDLEASVASTSLETCAKEATEKAVDAFQLLMAGGRRFTSKKESSHGLKTGLSRKDELYNNLIDDFKTKGLDFPKGTEAVEGPYIVQVFRNSVQLY